MLCANSIWGLMAPIAKVVMAGGLIVPLVLADFRMAGAMLLFWLASLFVKYEHVPLLDLLRLAGAGMLGVLFNQGCYIFGVSYTSPGEAAMITTTMPMWVMIFAWLILGEPITLKKAGGILLGAAGVLILIWSSVATAVKGQNPMLGDLLVFGAQISYALYLTFYRNFICRYSLFTLMKWMFTFATIAIMTVSVPTLGHTAWHSVTSAEWLGAAYVVVMGTFVAYICIMIGQKLLRPTVVGIYNYVQPIVATVSGICMGIDSLSVGKIIAVLLIFTGIYFVTISKSASQAK